MNQFETPSRRSILLAGASGFLGIRILEAQDERQSGKPTFSAGVKVVNVYATVKDKKGKIVQDLTKDDFTLEEDDRPQPIGYFARQSDLPLTLGLLVDTSASEARMISVEREASYEFLEKVLRPEKDRAFLLQFNTQAELLQDLTSSREKLEKALKLLETQSPGGGNGPGAGGQQPPPGGRGGGRGRGRGAGGSTVLCDAVYLASNEVLKAQTGRKAIILLGDGDDDGSKVAQAEAIVAAQRADALVYCVRIWDSSFGESGRPRFHYPGMGIPGGRGGGPGGGGPGGGGPGGGGGGGRGPGGPSFEKSGKERLEEFARRTGGGYFEVTKKQPLDQIYRAIEDELRNQYSLGYTPDASAHAGYRRIKVSVKKNGLVVRSREGYYSEPAAKA